MIPGCVLVRSEQWVQASSTLLWQTYWVVPVSYHMSVLCEIYYRITKSWLPCMLQVCSVSRAAEASPEVSKHVVLHLCARQAACAGTAHCSSAENAAAAAAARAVDEAEAAPGAGEDDHTGSAHS